MKGIAVPSDEGSAIQAKSDKYYAQFLRREYSPRSFSAVVVLTATYVVSAIHKLWKASEFSYVYVCCVVLLMMAVVVNLLLIWIYKPAVNCGATNGNNSARFLELQQAVCVPMMAVALGAGVLLELQTKSCAENPTIPYLVAGMRAFPFCILFTLRDTHFMSILFGLIMCLSAMFVIGLHSSSETRFTDLMTFGFAAAVFVYDNLGQTRSVRRLIAEFHHTLAENEKLAVEAQALELRAMIGNVAHDLKTPLTSFLSGIECMSEVVTTWSQAMQNAANIDCAECIAKSRDAITVLQRCLQTMQGTNSFMTMTINRCIDYTKASKGMKLVPKPETTELLAKLEMPLNLMRSVQSAVEVKLNPLDPAICTHIITDQQWLMENVLCLLSNAVKYSHKGTVEVSVSLEGAPPQQQFLRFEVQDTGVGLSEEAMQTLFSPFKQAQRMAGGTGLGLFSLAKRIESKSGRYGVHSRPDGAQGSVFWFAIPYRPDPLSARMAITSKLGHLNLISHDCADGNADISPLEESARLHSVLVVDDAPMIVKMTSMLLSRKGHTVESAVNGADALEKLLQGYESARCSGTATAVPEQQDSVIATPYDVVLMDLQMPVLDGVEAVRRLRAAEAKLTPKAGRNASCPPPHQLVIALSANSDEETRRTALEAGADAFMEKPFTYESFAKMLLEKEKEEKEI